MDVKQWKFLARGPHLQLWVRVILAVAFVAGRFWAVTFHDHNVPDVQYEPQHNISDGEDAWLSSLTH